MPNDGRAQPDQVITEPQYFHSDKNLELFNFVSNMFRFI